MQRGGRKKLMNRSTALLVGGERCVGKPLDQLKNITTVIALVLVEGHFGSVLGSGLFRRRDMQGGVGNPFVTRLGKGIGAARDFLLSTGYNLNCFFQQ